MLDWQYIEETHRSTVWAVVYRILAHEEDARDCCQDVFLEAMRQENAAQINNWGGYLRWLASRRAIDLLRTRRRQLVESFTPEHDVELARQDKAMEINELAEIVRDELVRIPETQATAFWLFSVEQLTYEEIATVTGTTVNAAGLKIHRARQSLKSRLAHLNPIGTESPHD
jgi:RNA polymerase sigma-70 factor, ECF subfamily